MGWEIPPKVLASGQNEFNLFNGIKKLLNWKITFKIRSYNQNIIQLMIYKSIKPSAC